MMLLYNNKQKELRIVEDKQGRLPLVGSDSSFSLLYCPYTLKLKHSVNGENWFNLKLEAQNLGGSLDTTTIRKTSGKWKATSLSALCVTCLFLLLNSLSLGPTAEGCGANPCPSLISLTIWQRRKLRVVFTYWDKLAAAAERLEAFVSLELGTVLLYLNSAPQRLWDYHHVHTQHLQALVRRGFEQTPLLKRSKDICQQTDSSSLSNSKEQGTSLSTLLLLFSGPCISRAQTRCLI
ncbi:hypothetical protein F2Q70_00031555 [Brassica cretica]|uniref:Uncharacterized protein n=1 Tax=Brassica cretica TaxID=69181 RepID=A0A8S9FM37_BRACR|nr:hypothetical protein F2Q70_00031555 [Brassica cretica]